MSGKYDDMVPLPHHVSPRRPNMPRLDRAAQFAPFAALAGYGAVLRETARRTERQVELDENAREALDLRLRLLLRALPDEPEVTVTYFRPDERKEGGAYHTVTGRVWKIEPLEKRMTLTDGTRLPIKAIVRLEGDLFRRLE